MKIKSDFYSYTEKQFKYLKYFIVSYLVYHSFFIYVGLHQYLNDFNKYNLLAMIGFSVGALFFDFLFALYLAGSYLFYFNNLYIYGLNHDYIHFSILVYLTIRFFNLKQKGRVVIPSILYNGLWFLIGVTYFCSAINKIFLNEYWMQPEKFITFLSQSPVFVFNFINNNYLLYFLYSISLIFLVLELSFVMSFFYKKLRKVYFVVSVCVHTGIFLLTQMSEVSLSILILHLFLLQFKNDQADSAVIEKSYHKIISYVVVAIGLSHSIFYIFTGGPRGEYNSLLNPRRAPITFNISPLPLVFDSDLFFSTTTVNIYSGVENSKSILMNQDFFKNTNLSKHLKLHLMRYAFFKRQMYSSNVFDQMICDILKTNLIGQNDFAQGFNYSLKKKLLTQSDDEAFIGSDEQKFRCVN